MATRNRLHGIKWPTTNPKLLDVDFLTCEDALRLTEGELVLERQVVLAEDTKKEAVVETSDEGAKRGEGTAMETDLTDGELPSEGTDGMDRGTCQKHHNTGRITNGELVNDN